MPTPAPGSTRGGRAAPDVLRGISRRSFLAGANALVLLAMLDACKATRHLGTASPAATSSATSDDIVTLLRQAVQASPDYLQGAAAAAVATKDVAAIAAFVRDRISVVPPWSMGEHPVTARRWGSAATLRGGAGTLRDRAELLVELLTAAGFTATVMSADRPAAIDLATLYQLRAADFEPDQALLDRAAKLLPRGKVPPAATASPDDTVATTAAKALSAAIPTDLQTAVIRADLLPSTVPVVAVATGSGTTSASAAAQYTFALGNLATTGAPPAGLDTAGLPAPTPSVAVTVWGLPNPAPGSTTPGGQLIKLVSATWTAEQVFGRQVMLNFVPPSGAAGFITGTAADQPVRVPLLHVQAELPAYAAASHTKASPSASASGTPAPPVGGSAADMSDFVITGTPITLQGDVLAQANATGPASLPGAYGPLVTLSAAERAAAMAKAASLRTIARATVFPEIELDVAVLDGAGNSIDGLDAAAFTVKDNGQQVPWVALMSNAVSSNLPRILVAYDTTGSVAETWPSAAAKATFEQTLASTLVTSAAQTPFDVQVLGLDGAQSPSPTAWAAPDQTKLLTALSNAGGNDSVVWGAASGAAIDQGVAAIIMVSDFQSGDDPTAVAFAKRRIAAAGIPVICLPIGKPDETALAQLVALSGGTRLGPLAPTTASALATLVGSRVATRALSSYRLRYSASTSGPAQRTVTVTLTGRSTPVGTATYTVPAAPGTPWSFVGLYVDVSIANVEAQTRHLAGLTLSGGRTPLGDLDDAAAAAETRAALCGVTTIAIEPGMVTTAALLDDVLSSVQSLQPLLALPSGSTAQQIVTTAQKDGVRRVPPVLAALLEAPVNVTNPHAVPTLRVAILQERASSKDGLDTRLDLPPTLNVVTPLGADPVAAFAAGLEVSSRAAANEAASFTSSAFKSLSGRQLTFVAAHDHGGLETFTSALPAEQQTAWKAVLDDSFYLLSQHFLLPTGGSTAAFWVVDTATGAATAVLLDGSGGALSEDSPCINGEIDGVGALLNMLNLALTVYALGCIVLLVNAFYCTGKAAGAIYITVGVILAIAGGIHSGNYLAELLSVAGLFIPLEAGAVRGAKGAQVIGTLAVGVLTGNYCPDPNEGVAPPEPPGGQSTVPPPVCSEPGSEDGVCR